MEILSGLILFHHTTVDNLKVFDQTRMKHYEFYFYFQVCSSTCDFGVGADGVRVNHQGDSAEHGQLVVHFFVDLDFFLKHLLSLE